MKLLHTSDWHLGQVLYNYDRTEEQQAFLAQLTQIVVREQPDAMLVCGDVFHTPAPAATTVKTYVNAMLELRRACPTMTIAVIAGNHDSASRIDCDRQLWQVAGVHVVGTVERGDDPAAIATRHLIAVHDAQGRAIGTIVAVPHSYRLPNDSFFANLLALADTTLPVVLMAHLTMTGCDLTGHDYIGTLDSTAPAAVGGYDYVALGHIHRPQFVPGTDNRVRYCGTPLAVSFDEQCEHSVSVVTLEKNKPPVVRTIPIASPKPLHTIPADRPVPLTEALERLDRCDDTRRCYIRLNVTIDTPLPPDAYETASRHCALKHYRLCTIRTSQPGSARNRQVAVNVDRFRQMSPVDVAQHYMAECLGRDITEREKQMITELISQINEEEHA